MMIKHIIWDFDGTLFDSYPGMVNAFLRALKKYEIEAEYDEVLKLFLNSEKTAVQYYQNQFLLGEELTEVYQDEKSHIDLSNMLPFPYAKEVCQRIKEARRYNGEVIPMWDAVSKQKALRELVEKYDIDLSQSYAYGDTTGDLTMFHHVGTTYAINPTKELMMKLMEDPELKEKINVIVERKDVKYKLDLNHIELI